MAKYMETAAKANEEAKKLMELIPDALRPAVAEHIARLVNLGFRCNPRAAHGTIRLNAVKAAVKGLPVKVSMKEVPKSFGTGTFNALVTEQIGVEAPKVTVEGDDGGEE